MKRIVGIALGMALGATIVHAGGTIGGFGRELFYNTVTHTLTIPGKLADYIFIARQGSSLDSEVKAYPMKALGFASLQDAADSQLMITVKGADEKTRSYWVNSGEELNEVELADRRAA
jgi:hypothetical protein